MAGLTSDKVAQMRAEQMQRKAQLRQEMAEIAKFMRDQQDPEKQSGGQNPLVSKQLMKHLDTKLSDKFGFSINPQGSSTSGLDINISKDLLGNASNALFGSAGSAPVGLGDLLGGGGGGGFIGPVQAGQTPALGGFSDFMGGLGGGAQGPAQAVGGNPGLLGNAGQMIGNAVQGVGSAAGGAAQGFGGMVGGAGQLLGGALGGAGSAIAGGAGAAASGVGSALAALLSLI